VSVCVWGDGGLCLTWRAVRLCVYDLLLLLQYTLRLFVSLCG
jgi:hypothetical protein